MDFTIRNDDGDFFADRHDWDVYLTVELCEDNNTVIVKVDDRHSSERQSTPMDVWSGRVLQWEQRTGSGVVSRAQLEALVERITPMLNTVAEGRTVDYDTSGPGKATTWSNPEAEDAADAIGRIVEDWDWRDDSWGVWDAREWVADNWGSTAKELGLTAGATAGDKAAAEAKIIEWANGDNVKLYDTDKAIDWLVEKIAEAATPWEVTIYGAPVGYEYDGWHPTKDAAIAEAHKAMAQFADATGVLDGPTGLETIPRP
jgi:hypothetical protein